MPATHADKQFPDRAVEKCHFGVWPNAMTICKFTNSAQISLLPFSASLAVDDSTGVINCICWKKSNNTESSSATTAAAALGELNLTSQLKKLQDTIEQKTKIEIGDIIQIRGYVHTYREEREIRVTTYYKVEDPVCNIQIARMLELPSIYRKVYDQPFCSPALEQERNWKLWNLCCPLPISL